jgi:hypothetical protein
MDPKIDQNYLDDYLMMINKIPSIQKLRKEKLDKEIEYGIVEPVGEYGPNGLGKGKQAGGSAHFEDDR